MRKRLTDWCRRHIPLGWQSLKGAGGRPCLTSVHYEMHRGALIGLLVCCLLGAMQTASAAALAWFAGLGMAAGTVIGLLVWLDSPGLHEDPVMPPDPRQKRWCKANQRREKAWLE